MSMLRGLAFEPSVAPVRHWRNRMDVACFLGFVRRRANTDLPPSVMTWLRDEGWIDAPDQPTAEGVATSLDHIPIPIDDWAMFERIFEVRSGIVSKDAPTARSSGYLAAAVRSFFAQGGRRCLVVGIEHPSDLDLRATALRRAQALAQLLPELAGDVAAVEPFDRTRWRGLGLLHGLDDVALICVPDLPWLVGQIPELLTPIEPAELARAAFFECSDRVPPRKEVIRTPPIAIARCDELEYRAWGAAVRSVSGFLARYRRDVQFVAALPLPTQASLAHRDPIKALVSWELLAPTAPGAAQEDDDRGRFVQLVYPWIGWTGSQGLPENLEPGDGALVGAIARGTLLAGAFRSVGGRRLYEIDRFEPKLSRALQERESVPDEAPLIERLSLLGPAPNQFEVLSDVTSTNSAAYRLANIQRLHAVWIRALRQAGELFVFESANEQTWSDLRSQLEGVALALYRNGALRGDNPAQAFDVRCDRTTMSQRDIDEGRLVAEIRYRPVAPLELIRVSLALAENREVSIVSESVEVSA
jgi:hypothetical protein